MIPHAGYGQYYRSLPVNSESHYAFANDSLCHGGECIVSVRIDSSYIVGNDTVYEFYRTVRPQAGLPGNCIFTTRGASWLGYRVVMRSDYRHFYFNKSGDTINIPTRRSFGGEYVLYSYPNDTAGKFLQGKVIKQYAKPFLNIADNTRVHQITTKDGQQVELENELFNEQHIDLSWNFGMHQTYNLWEFPYDTTAYLLAGITRSYPPQIMLMDTQNVRARQIFDYNLGDEFHYKRYKHWGDAMMNYTTLTKEKRMVVYKNVSTTGDTLTYWFRRTQIQYNSSSANSSDTIFKIDTITETIALNNYRFLDKFANELYTAEEGLYNAAGYIEMFRNTWFAKRIQKVVHEPFYHDSVNHCLSPSNQSLPTHTYADGLGLTTRYDAGTDVYNLSYDSLIYLQKGLLVWGKPYIFSKLLSVEVVENISWNALVYPNPATDQLTVRLTGYPNRAYRVRLFDLIGNRVGQWSVAGSNAFQQLSLAQLSPGIYLLQIEDSYGNRITKRVNKL